MTASTKSLFRATKWKASTGEGFLGGLPDQRAPEAMRNADDFYPTVQLDPIRALLAADGASILGLGSVWENAVGAGDLANEIAAFGPLVIGSDLVDRNWPGTIVRSFYDFDDSPARCIISNPPYDQINCRDGAGRWLRHTLALPSWRYCAYLLSWDWPAADKGGFGAMLDEQPFSYCYLMRWKIDFTGAGSPPQRNAWFVWDRDDPRSTRDKAREPGFRWLRRTDPRQSAMMI